MIGVSVYAAPTLMEQPGFLPRNALEGSQPETQRGGPAMVLSLGEGGGMGGMGGRRFLQL